MDITHTHVEEKAKGQALLPSYMIQPIIIPSEQPRRPSSGQRRLKAFLILISLWLVYQVTSEYIYFKIKQNFGSEYRSMSIAHATDWPIPPDVTIDHCALWVDSYRRRGFQRQESFANFDAPLSSGTIFLLSRGATAGSISMVQSSGIKDIVRVEVKARYQSRTSLDRVRVCAITRGEGENGVGLFSPERHIYVDFEITVYFPEAVGGIPVHVKNLETDLPLFSHGVSDLARTVNFGKISLQSANEPIVVESLSAEIAQIRTFNSAIEGNFNTSSSLALTTANARIKANVGLFNDEGVGMTDLTMTTSNGQIAASLHLLSAQGTGGKFKVSATTSLSALGISIETAPLSSTLLLDAQTSLASNTVRLHETFEGRFDLKTSLQRPVVVVDDDVSDPAGRGRKRNVQVNHMGSSYISGSAAWSDGGELLGSVDLRTSLASATLKL